MKNIKCPCCGAPYVGELHSGAINCSYCKSTIIIDEDNKIKEKQIEDKIELDEDEIEENEIDDVMYVDKRTSLGTKIALLSISTALLFPIFSKYALNKESKYISYNDYNGIYSHNQSIDNYNENVDYFLVDDNDIYLSGISVTEDNPAKINIIPLDLTGWEEGFVKAYKYYTRYVPLLKEMNGKNLAALYFLANYNFTPEELVSELASKKYISGNNCVDLGIIREDDPNTAEDETMSELVDPKGFDNFINATDCYSKINDMAERKMRVDWLKLQENGGGTLDPANYPDPSRFIQDIEQRKIVHDWYVAFVEGYDLTKGTFSNNEKLQYVYRAIGQLNGDRDEPSLNSLDPSVAFLVRATLGNWYKQFTEIYMYNNYSNEIVNNIHYYDKEEFKNNLNFVKYEDAKLVEGSRTRELNGLINEREVLYRIITSDITDKLFGMLNQSVISHSEYLEIKGKVKSK